MTAPPFRVKALYDYLSEEDDDLKFRSNQIITVTDVEDADWYYGEFEDDQATKVEGLFPKNFVKILEPEAPPRPARSLRNKKDPDAAASSTPVQTAGTIADKNEQPAVKPQPTASASDLLDSKPSRNLSSSDTPIDPEEPKAPAPTPGGEPAPSKSPPVSEKPSSNAFRDRINAFNKPAAPPIAPVKPAGLSGAGTSGFVKKPFVAPPPSKNAYVPPPREIPPQRVYRHEEDRDVPEQADKMDAAESKVDPVSRGPPTEDEDQPAPASLKDRIALLQKQQMEQAARHADAAQKKDKGRKARKAVETDEGNTNVEEGEHNILEKIDSGDTESKRAVEGSRRRRPSRNENAASLADSTHPRDVLSDGNDADQSGAGDTEEGDEVSTGRDDSDNKPERRPSFSASTTKQREQQILSTGDDEDPSDDEDEDQALEDVDPEVRRRMEIRERMAKMSGGMGMAGMFGPSPALSSKAPTKKASLPNERKSSGASGVASSVDTSRAAPVPIIPIPGMQKVASPDEHPLSMEEDRHDGEQSRKQALLQDSTNAPEPQEEPHTSRKSLERPLPPPVPKDRQTDSHPVETVSPVTPSSEQNNSQLSSAARAVPPPPPPRQLMSPSEGSESDDELSSHDQRALDDERLRRSSNDEPPPTVSRGGLPQRIASDAPRNTSQELHGFPLLTEETLPASNDKKTSIAAPPLQAPQHRAPPPPPPTGAPSRRSMTGDKSAGQDQKRRHHQDEEEVTEYDGDYDTDIASGAAHKDALKAHARASSQEDASITEEGPRTEPSYQSTERTPPAAPRAVPPPPPPSILQHPNGQSDLPRAAPPPPPHSKHGQEETDEYDPYRYNSPLHGVSSPFRESGPSSKTPTAEEPDVIFSPPVPQHKRMQSAGQPQASQSEFTSLSMQGQADHRQSSDMHRTSTTVRRSGDATRRSEDHFMAGDVELSSNGWWAQPNLPPPIFQNRRDVIFEIDESSTTRRGGKRTVAKEVYILFMDYSQTQVSVQFEATEPEAATKLEQKHEPPPRSLRQDQLESAHERYGPHIASAAKSKEGTTVGDGSPHGLPHEIISVISDALPPVGTRAYGAPIYTNLANATIQQYDEIRQGDVATFRNARFGGHRGPMKTKYSIEVGKPDHVGIVVDWDGSKKKLRVWEQGRESKKAKIESFKLGDMKSGEVKVWRVMSRAWVGWEGNS